MPCLRLRDAEPPRPPDERCFAAWSPDEVAEWTRHKFAEDSRARDRWAGDPAARAADEAYLSSLGSTMRGLAAAAALRGQMVDGASLEHLTLDRMVAMGVPFGAAVSLKGYVDGLIEARGGGRGGVELPGWYRDMSSYASSYTTAEGANQGEFESDDVESARSNAAESPDDGRAQMAMRERFGLELPAIRGRDAAEVIYRGRNQPTQSEDFSNPTSSQLSEHLEASPLAAAAESTSASSGSIPDELLSGMPAHIRNIAKRRPDIVSKILLEKKQQQEQPSSERMERDGWSDRFQPPTIDEGVDEEEEDGVYDSGREDGADERVGLLRRHPLSSRITLQSRIT